MPTDYVIWSFEHRAWWRPAGWGYTEQLALAGRYTEAEAQAIVAKANVVRVNVCAIPLAMLWLRDKPNP